VLSHDIRSRDLKLVNANAPTLFKYLLKYLNIYIYIYIYIYKNVLIININLPFKLYIIIINKLWFKKSKVYNLKYLVLVINIFANMLSFSSV
jgi:hypothetical protein